MLRSVYTLVEGKLGQRIATPGPITLPVIDLSGLPEEKRRLETERLMREAARKPFDLLHGSAMHAALVRLSANEHLLLLVFHHIAFDAWSAGVLLRELPALYEPRQNLEPSEPASSPLQYPDFAAWQRRCFEVGVWRKGLAYWKEELSGQLPVFDLPFARPRAAGHCR